MATSVPLLAAVLVLSVTPARAADWPRFGGDAQLTNDVPSAAAAHFLPSAASSLQVRWGQRLDGPVIASPLYADAVMIGGRPVNAVYASTQAGSVYALDAVSGTVLWQRQLGTAASTCSEAQAGVDSVYGVSSTGVIDRTRNVLYVIGATGFLYALDLGTGQTAPGWPVQVVEDTSGEYVWGGLTLPSAALFGPNGRAVLCEVVPPDSRAANERAT